MSEIFRSLAIAAAILLPVVVLVVIASIAAVKRGEFPSHGLEPAHDAAPSDAEPESAKNAKPSFIPDRDPTVLEILLLAVVLFTLTMGLFLGFSVMQQLL